MSLLGQALLWSWMPGAFWMVYVESCAPQRSSWFRLASTFLAGALSVGLVLGFHHLMPVDLSRPPLAPVASFVYFTVVVGLLEETAKMAAVLLVAFPRRDFREPWDGLACASAAALGFATAENFQYVLQSGEPTILVGRFVLSTLAHVVMSAFWGYALGLRRLTTVLEALGWAALSHGAYDFFLMQDWSSAAVGVLVALVVVFRQRLQEAYYASARRQAPSRRVRECRACRALGPAEHTFCSHCGQRRQPEGPVVCLACLGSCPELQAQCPHCQRALAG